MKKDKLNKKIEKFMNELRFIQELHIKITICDHSIGFTPAEGFEHINYPFQFMDKIHGMITGIQYWEMRDKKCCK
jgi:hypothetical protein